MKAHEIKPDALYLCGEHPCQWYISGVDLLAKLDQDEALNTDEIQIKEVTA